MKNRIEILVGKLMLNIVLEQHIIVDFIIKSL